MTHISTELPETLPAAPYSAPEPQEGAEDQGEPQAAQEPSEAPQERPEPTKRVGATYARQMDERMRVMEERLNAFVRELHSVGVYDTTTPMAGVKASYQEALGYIERASDEIRYARERTAHVRDVFDNL